MFGLLDNLELKKVRGVGVLDRDFAFFLFSLTYVYIETYLFLILEQYVNVSVTKDENANQ